MERFGDIDWLSGFGPSILTTLITLGLMYGVYRVVHARWDRSVRRDVVHAALQLIIGLFGIVIIVMLLPVDDPVRQDMLTVGGLMLTAIVGFSSTTVIKDGAAGVALRFMSSFRRGDYISTNEAFGRVSEIGFFHTELQSEDRSLITVTNSQLLKHSFEVIPASGTIIHTSVSLRYDIPRSAVESALLQAAEKSELKDPFVHIEALGTDSITYKVAGLLKETDSLLTERSNFRKNVLDSLHEQRIEMIAPHFQSTRAFEDRHNFIPDGCDDSVEAPFVDAEALIFDKALKARKLEDLDELVATIETRISEEDAELSPLTKERLKKRLTVIQKRREEVKERLAEKV